MEAAMEDAVRPNREAFKAMYERGYRTWASLWDSSAEQLPLSDLHGLLDPSPLLRHHPHFVPGVRVDVSSSIHRADVSGLNTWQTTRGPCDLPSFQTGTDIRVGWTFPTPVNFSSQSTASSRLVDMLAGEGNHISVLVLAWTYVLSARWAELIPGAYISMNETSEGTAREERVRTPSPDSCVVDVGDADESAVKWWRAVLAADGTWNASIKTVNNHVLYSPWFLLIMSGAPFTVVADTELPSHRQPDSSPVTFDKAMEYLLAYCHYHHLDRQCELALAAALLIPKMKYQNDVITLPVPRKLLPGNLWPGSPQSTPITSTDASANRFDQLLTLSCYTSGVSGLLQSAFAEPEIDGNLYGAWLQGAAAFLDSENAQDRSRLLCTLVHRDPALAILWIGAFISGADARCRAEAMRGFGIVDLPSAAWTETLSSFIQLGMPAIPPETSQLSRADESRLTYLVHGPWHVRCPMYPSQPFGFTAMSDTWSRVRKHAQCGAPHQLEYKGFTWISEHGERIEQPANDASSAPIFLRPKRGMSSDYATRSMAIDYARLDFEGDRVSEAATGRLFTWLRGGFPRSAAEKAIYEHRWVDNFIMWVGYRNEIEGDGDSSVES
jgi:hypothetical protein